MYGMIHRSARDMVVAEFGPDAWTWVLEKSGFGEAQFIGSERYPDQTTFALIGAVCDVVGLAPDQVLRAFGRHWIKAADEGPYSGVMRILGPSLLESLRNLDAMHASIQIALPDADLPQFSVMKADEAEILVSYVSSRQGLDAFVQGLFEGLLRRFQTEGAVTAEGPSGEGRVFKIALAAA